MTDTVRKQKSGDQLAVGDWLAPNELLDGAAEVLYVNSWPASMDRSRDNTGKHVRLVVREQGATSDYADVVSGSTLFDLATEEDLAALRVQVEREQLANELRQLAAMIADPSMPVPQYGISMYASFKTAAEVRAAAEVFSLPVESRKPNAGVQTPEWPQGRKSYEQGIHLHWLTIADEPEDPAEPAPTVQISDETIAQAARMEGQTWSEREGRWVDTDKLGLAYSRADDEPEGDVTQQLGHRIEPHVGGLTEQGLVDETLPSPCGCPVRPAPGIRGDAADTLVEHRDDCTVVDETEGVDEKPAEQCLIEHEPGTPEHARHYLGLEESAKHNPPRDLWAPCVPSLHIPTPGEDCLVCGAEGMRYGEHVEVSAGSSDGVVSAQCACGVEVDGFNDFAEARAELEKHIRDAS